VRRALGYRFAAVGITLPLFSFFGACGSSNDQGGAGPGAGGASVLQFHNHANRDGLFIDSALTEAAVATMHLDKTFAGTIGGNVYASPLYVENGVGGKGTFYIATEDNNVYALDEATGAAQWTTGPAALGAAARNTGAGCGNIGPIGVTGTPAVDLGTRLLVFDSAKADAAGGIATHTIWALSIDDGSVKWSVDVSTLTANGVTFSPQPQNERGAALIVGGIAYVVFGGHYGDCGNYRGWVVGVPLTGSGAKAWATQVKGAGIWGPGGAASDGQSIFVTTGNGFGSSATWAESEGVFRLDPGPSYAGTPADYFAPSDWKTLDNGDVDISGSGPLVIDAPSMNPSALVLAQGKDGNLYLLDRTNLGGVGTASVGTLQVLSGEITNAGAWATIGGATYVVVRPNGGGSGMGCPNGTAGDLVGVKLDPTAAQKMTVAWCVDAQGEGSPSITSSDGTHDAMVWTAGAEGSSRLHSWDLLTGNPVFKGGAAADAIPNVRRFTTPIAAHGRVFVGGDNRLYAFTP
jgi:outer membrane protein assembly factor BamB